MKDLSTIATLSIASGLLSLLCLVALHLVSPEYSPAWRMVSEYALGKHKWVLTAFFTFWGVSTLLIACLLWHIVTTPWVIFGVILVFISGVGAVMGGLFDVKNKLHTLSFMLGVPTLPIGALLISYHLIKNESWDEHQSIIVLSAHAVWISMVLMGISMVLIFSGFKKAGISVGPNVEPPEVLPGGVVGINGYANRLLIVCYIAWPLLIASLFHLITAN